MDRKKNFGFIGGGRVTYFLLKALKDSNQLPRKIVVADPNEGARKKAQQISPESIRSVGDNREAAREPLIFLALHPPVLKDALGEIKDLIRKDSIVISLAPVMTIEKLSGLLDGFSRIVRMIPNGPSIIGQGYNPVVFSDAIHPEEKQELKKLFALWGEAPEVKEETLEGYAIITAMGPTYFWPQWMELQKLGREFGITDEELKLAMPTMLLGSVKALYESGLTSEEVMDLVPIYPLKDKEETIQEIFREKLRPLYQKLKGIPGNR